MAFHNATKYYALSDAEPGDEHIGIGDPANRTAAIGRRTGTSSRCCTRSTSRSHRSGCRVSCRTRVVPALAAIAATGTEAPSATVVPDKALLGRLGLLTNGSLDRAWTTPDGRVHQYRTAGGTGALYHLELYFVCADLADLSGWRVPLLRHRPHHAPGARGRLPDRAHRGHRTGAVDRRRTRRACDDEHVLAQRLALPGARLPAHLLGRRYLALAHPRRRGVGAGHGHGSSSDSPTRSSTHSSTSTEHASPRWRSSRWATPRPPPAPAPRAPPGSISPPGDSPPTG